MRRNQRQATSLSMLSQRAFCFQRRLQNFGCTIDIALVQQRLPKAERDVWIFCVLLVRALEPGKCGPSVLFLNYADLEERFCCGLTIIELRGQACQTFETFR